MADVREDILARLLEVAAAVPNVRWAQRNSVDVPENLLPAVMVFDADEETTDTHNRPSNSPFIVQMTPEIVFMEQADEVGSDLTTLRREFIKGVLYDAELNNLVAKSSPRGNGAIRYLGCNTDFGWGRSQSGFLRVLFMFKYTLRPEEL